MYIYYKRIGLGNPWLESEGLQTDSLRSNKLTEEWGEQDEQEGIRDPGQILQRDVPFQLAIDPLISWRMEEKNNDRQGSLRNRF